ncbi:MAG: GntR family transcriptional regulator [Thermoanaerobaculum sp.]|nr:GntR family transcriptional regulator [Thermoanaerobaculum sp.]MDW7966782.1 GntR family transcriptional regulator [Thermoanaerobaculum sp.]
MAEHDQKVQRLQLSQQVADLLRQRILNGQVPAGSWLRQDHLARELGVSAIPVREALKLLAAQGLVEHLPYRGIRVVQLSSQELEDLYAVRAFVEGLAARFAALHVTEEEVARLQQLCQAMEACDTPDTLPRYRELNRQFHLGVAAGSRRSYLIRLVEQFWTAYPTMLWSNYPQVAESSLPGRALTDSQEHRAIVAALQQREPEVACRAMEEHVRRAGQALVGFVRSREQHP